MNSTDTNTPQDFTPPRHWIGAEELEASYWADAQTRERRGQEFYDKPVETISLIEKMDTKGIARRDFLTIMGASMAMASFACARRPVHKIIPYVVKPDEVTPGVANWYASTASDTGEGVLIKVREGRPIKLEGNPDHPLSRGALSARTQATLLDLYDPDRLQAPRGGTWAEADAAISAALKKAGKVRILSAPIRGESTRRLVNEFLAAFPGGALVEYDPLHLDEIADGQAECYGNRVMPRYRFDKAEMVLSLGADFLGVWPNSTEHMADWAKGRKLSGADAAHAKMSKLVAFESTMSLTGANADERTPIRPGDELKVALAIAHELIVSLKVTRFAGDGSVTAALAGYRPETVAAEIGLVGGVDKIKSAAKALWDARGRGLVVAGSLQAKSRDALALQIAVNLLNSALDNEGATIDGTVAADTRPAQSFSGIEKLVSEMNSGAIEVLILHRVNPAYAAPGTLKFEAALRKVPLVVFVGDRDDETGAMAQYALPVHHALESWGDAHPRQGLYSLQQPAIAPIHSTRSFEDGLLTWIKSGALKANGLAARVAVAPADQNTWHDYLKANWRETVYAGAGTLGSFDQFWEGVLREGVYLANYAPANGAARSSARTFRTGAVTSLPRYRQSTEGVMLALYAKASMYDGRWANNAWMQEMPDPISTITWDNYLNISSDLAQQYSLATHDMVELTVGMTSI